MLGWNLFARGDLSRMWFRTFPSILLALVSQAIVTYSGIQLTLRYGFYILCHVLVFLCEINKGAG